MPVDGKVQERIKATPLPERRANSKGKLVSANVRLLITARFRIGNFELRRPQTQKEKTIHLTGKKCGSQCLRVLPFGKSQSIDTL